MSFTKEWRMTLAGLVVLLFAVGLLGCQEPARQPDTQPAPVVETPVPPTPSEPVEPVTEPVIEPVTEGRDPTWDCTPTGNRSIDTWKRDAKCGGKLDGE